MTTLGDQKARVRYRALGACVDIDLKGERRNRCRTQGALRH
ncbi:hypothetical protein [Vibrio tubiashii]|nr:hypothetical protein [Vibrio tubiashii]